MSSSTVSTRNFWVTRRPRRRLCGSESASGMKTPSRRSGPTASAHSAVQRLESIPPDTPSTAPRRCRDRSWLRMALQIRSTSAAASSRSTSAEKFFCFPVNAVTLLPSLLGSKCEVSPMGCTKSCTSGPHARFGLYLTPPDLPGVRLGQRPPKLYTLGNHEVLQVGGAVCNHFSVGHDDALGRHDDSVHGGAEHRVRHADHSRFRHTRKCIEHVLHFLRA